MRFGLWDHRLTESTSMKSCMKYAQFIRLILCVHACSRPRGTILWYFISGCNCWCRYMKRLLLLFLNVIVDHSSTVSKCCLFESTALAFAIYTCNWFLFILTILFIRSLCVQACLLILIDNILCWKLLTFNCTQSSFVPLHQHQLFMQLKY